MEKGSDLEVIMKKGLLLVSAAFLAAGFVAMPVQAREEKIESGIYVEDIDLSGMTKDQARQEIEDYVAGFGGARITLHVNDVGEIVTTAAELGLKWGNDDILEEAVNFGRDGDIFSCYRELKNLEFKNKVYRVRFDFDQADIRSLIEENAGQYNQEAVNATLQKTEEGFSVTEGQTGRVIDTEASVQSVYDYLTGDWNGGACDIDLTVKVDEPQGTAEDLEKVRDVLGTFTTSFATSGGARSRYSRSNVHTLELGPSSSM